MTKCEIAKQRMKHIREDWFSEHKATVERHGDLTVVKWRKPNTGVYAVRYVFDEHYLYISGDIGEAVFNFTWDAKPSDFKRIDIDYLHGKLAAIRNADEYDFVGDVAIDTIKTCWKDELDETYADEIKDDETEEYEGIYMTSEDASEYLTSYPEIAKADVINITEELFEAAEESCSQHDWIDRISRINWDKIDQDAYEWLYDCGNVYAYRFLAYLVGLQMIAEQISLEN